MLLTQCLILSLNCALLLSLWFSVKVLLFLIHFFRDLLGFKVHLSRNRRCVPLTHTYTAPSTTTLPLMSAPSAAVAAAVAAALAHHLHPPTNQSSNLSFARGERPRGRERENEQLHMAPSFGDWLLSFHPVRVFAARFDLFHAVYIDKVAFPHHTSPHDLRFASLRFAPAFFPP